MQRETVRLTRAHRWTVIAVAGAVLATGVLWLVFHYFVRVAGEFGDAPHPLESWWLQLHGAAAMASLLVLGSLVRGHIINGWKAGRHRLSGGVVAAVAATLVASGWALYYVGSEDVRPLISVAHWVVGVSGALALPLHIRLARRRAQLRRMHSSRVA